MGTGELLGKPNKLRGSDSSPDRYMLQNPVLRLHELSAPRLHSGYSYSIVYLDFSSSLVLKLLREGDPTYGYFVLEVIDAFIKTYRRKKRLKKETRLEGYPNFML